MRLEIESKDNGAVKRTVILLVLIIITTIKFFKVDKIAGVLMIPYIGWVAFASYLTFYIWMFNEM